MYIPIPASFPPMPVDCPTYLLELGMTVRRSALVLIGVATLASFAAGWWVGEIAKSKTKRTPLQDLAMLGCTLILDPDNPPKSHFVSAAAPKDDVYETKILP